MVKIGDKIKSAVVRNCDNTRPELEVIGITKNATGWIGLDSDQDILIMVRDDIGREFEIFIDTII
jgi:hypothetical protein